MKEHFKNLKNLIDGNGKFIGTEEEKKSSIQAAEALAKSLLGATLKVRGNKFIIRMLEIYYGGIEDNSHDWYRNRFVYKKSKYIEQTNAQNNEGFRIYLSSMNIEDTYTRFDIVAGSEGVPVSFLIRSVWDSNFKTNETKKGNPHIALKTVGLNAKDHDKEIGNSDIFIEDTSEEIKIQKKLIVKTQRRINVNSEFEEKNHVSWNFYLE